MHDDESAKGFLIYLQPSALVLPNKSIDLILEGDPAPSSRVENLCLPRIALPYSNSDEK
jgi:hypothetical protein